MPAQATNAETGPRGFTFPKVLHVRKDREFRRIYRQGGRARGHYLSVVVLRNRLGHSRLGLSVSKKLGKAVRRNRIKRMVREAYRQIRWEIEARAGDVDVVVIPNLPEGHYPLADLIAELPLLCEKAAGKLTGRRGDRGGRGRGGGRGRRGKKPRAAESDRP